MRLPDIQGVQLSPDGKTVFTGSPFAAYDVATGRRLVQNRAIYSFVFFELNPAGTRMVMLPYGEGGNDLLVVDTRTGRIVNRLSGLLGVNVWTVSWSPTGHRVAGTAQDGSVVVWNASSGEVEHSISNQDGATYGLAFSPDGSTLYTAGANRQVHAWDLDGYRSFLRRTHVEETPLDGGSFIEPSADASRIAYQSGGFEDLHHELTFLDLATGKAAGPMRLADPVWFGAGGWRPDGKRFVTGYGGGVVRVLDSSTGAQVAARSTGRGLVTETAYTFDGSEIVVSSKSGEVRILDAETLAPVHEAVQLEEPVLHVATNPSGETAFVILGGPARRWYEDYAATRWALLDTANGTVVRSGDLGIDGAEFGAFSPDGVHAVAVGRQSQVVVIDTTTGATTVGPTGRQRGTIVWVTYDADGSRFVTGSVDRTLRLWDATTGAQLGTVRLPRGVAYGGFRPDGTIVATSPAGAVYLWDPSLDAAAEFACRAAARNLSRQVWQQSVGDQPYVEACPGLPDLSTPDDSSRGR